MIDTVIFDLAEVYLQGLIGAEKHLVDFFPVPQDKILPLLEGENFWNYMNGRITEDIYIGNIIAANGLGAHPDAIKAALRKNFIEVPGTRPIIEQVGKRGYKMGLLSVHGKEWIEHCEQTYDYHRLFHTVMYSYQVGVSKPDARAFALILQAMDSTPARTLFIDDSRRNIAAATALGINTIRFENAEQLRQELHKREIFEFSQSQ